MLEKKIVCYSELRLVQAVETAQLDLERPRVKQALMAGLG